MTSFMEDKEDGACCAAKSQKIGNLTKKLKNGILPKNQQYFIKTSENRVVVKFYGNKGFRGIVKEVLAPCDYDHFVEANNMVKQLREENKRFREGLEDVAYCKTWFYQNDPARLVTWAFEALGEIYGKDYKPKIVEENAQLRQLLKDCKDKVDPIMGDIPTFKKLITRINEVLK